MPQYATFLLSINRLRALAIWAYIAHCPTYFGSLGLEAAMLGNRWPIVPSVGAVVLSASTAVAQTPADKVAKTRVVSQQYEMFGKRDAVGYGKLFTKDGTFISMPGLKIDGRRDITDTNAKFFAFMSVDKTRMVYKRPRIKFLGKKRP